MLINIQPKTFVIALKGHPISEAQLTDCLASAKKFNWNIEVSWGVNGRSINETLWKHIGVVPLLNKPTMPQIGTQGCFFSHWNLWQQCIKLNEPIVILEHDAIIQGKWEPLLIEDVVKLHARYKPKKIRYDEHTGNWSTSGHAYCITPRAVQSLIEFSKKVGGIPVDILMGDNVVNVTHLGTPELVARQNTFSTTTNIG
jgi:GR25 family glycosyltransferase involved in LPS biosynthesis